MWVNCAYHAISKSLKQLPNYLIIAETSIVLIVFSGVICDVCLILSLFLSLALHESLLGPRLYNTEAYLTPFISNQNHIIAG